MLLKFLVGAGWTQYPIQYIILLGIYRLVQMYVICTVYNILTICKRHVRTIKIARYYILQTLSQLLCSILFHAGITQYIIMKLKYYSLIENETCFKYMKAKVLLEITVFLAFILFHSIVYRYNWDEYIFACIHFNIHFKGLSENNQNMCQRNLFEGRKQINRLQDIKRSWVSGKMNFQMDCVTVNL